ncbi:MAG: recombinase family protein [Firmicutes bacterium]|nr:recombinase family protein [Alicyclobacillaceae bacterium]MCL6498114.1 recombinase family protein [Bacillota bacterium]
MRAALYKRVSSVAQARDGYSLEFQDDILRAHCAREHLEIAGVYEDGGRSGANTRREGLQQLIADAKRRRFDVVLIFRVDRFSREPLDLLFLVNELKALGIQLRSVTEAVDANDPAGELMLTILGAIGKFVRQNILDNAMKGKRVRAGKGKYTGGAVPYGYVVQDNGVYAPDDRPVTGSWTPATVVPELYRRYAAAARAGRGIQAVVDWLLDTQVPPPKERWTKTSVRQILRNPVYTGDFVYAKTSQAGHGTARPAPPDRWIRVPDNHPPLVDRPTWEQVQGLLDANRRHTRPRRPESEQDVLLAGFLTCAVCGSNLVPRRTVYQYKGKVEPRVHFTCGSRYNFSRKAARTACAFPFLRMEALDALVWQFLVGLATDPHIVARVVEEAKRGHQPRFEALQHQLESLRKDRAAVETKMRRLVDRAADGTIPPDLLQEKMQALDQQRQHLGAQIQRLEAEVRRVARTAPQLVADPDKVRAYLHDLLQGAALSVSQKRQVLAALVGHRGITVAPDGTVQLNLRIPPDALRRPVEDFIVETDAVSKLN